MIEQNIVDLSFLKDRDAAEAINTLALATSSASPVVNVVTNFDADPTGVRDSTSALNAAFAYSSAHGLPALLPKGTYKITSGLTPIVGNDIMIRGEGPASIISYQGNNAITDIMTIGDGVTTYVRFNLLDFRIVSTTPMSAGYAIHLKKMSYGNVNVIFDGKPFGNGYLYHGLRCNASSIIDLHDSLFFCEGDSIAANDGVELHCNHAFIEGTGNTGNGLHIGGGYGGVYTESLGQIFNNIGILIDTTLSAVGNNQIYISDSTVFDTNHTAAIYFDDALSSGKVAYLEGWFASSVNGNGCTIVNWHNGAIRSGTGKFYNNSGIGLALNDPTCTVALGTSVHIENNGTYGISATNAITITSSCLPINNTTAAFNSNVTKTLTLSGLNLNNTTTLIPQTAPSNPSSGWALYVDSGDSNKLKAKASNGTVVTLGTP